MDFVALSEMIQTVGMSAVILVASMYFIYHMYNKNREDMKEQQKIYSDLLKDEQGKHSEEMDKMTTAINNNTIVLTKIMEILRKEE